MKKLDKKTWLIIWSILLGVVLLTIVFINIPVKQAVSYFLAAKLEYVILFLLVSFFIQFFAGWRWWVILKSQGHPLNFWTISVAYKYAGYAVSFLTPGPRVGGEPLRAGLLTKHKIKFAKGLSSVVIDKSIEISLTGIFFIAGCVTILINFALPDEFKALIIILSAAIILGIVYFYQQMLKDETFFLKVCKFCKLNKIKNFKKWEKSIEEFENHIRTFYKRDKKEFFYACLLSTLSWGLMFLEYKFALLILGFDVSFHTIFFIFSFVGMAYLIPIPLALGSLEAGQISVFKIFNMDGAAGVALSMLIRGRDLLWTFVGLLILSYYGVRYAGNKKRKKNRKTIAFI